VGPGAHADCRGGVAGSPHSFATKLPLPLVAPRPRPRVGCARTARARALPHFLDQGQAGDRVQGQGPPGQADQGAGAAAGLPGDGTTASQRREPRATGGALASGQLPGGRRGRAAAGPGARSPRQRPAHAHPSAPRPSAPRPPPQERDALLSKRKATNRELERTSNVAAGAVPSGDKPWERVLRWGRGGAGRLAAGQSHGRRGREGSQSQAGPVHTSASRGTGGAPCCVCPAATPELAGWLSEVAAHARIDDHAPAPPASSPSTARTQRASTWPRTPSRSSPASRPSCCPPRPPTCQSAPEQGPLPATCLDPAAPSFRSKPVLLSAKASSLPVISSSYWTGGRGRPFPCCGLSGASCGVVRARPLPRLPPAQPGMTNPLWGAAAPARCRRCSRCFHPCN
jgi:hypothetical protein